MRSPSVQPCSDACTQKSVAAQEQAPGARQRALGAFSVAHCQSFCCNKFDSKHHSEGGSPLRKLLSPVLLCGSLHCSKCSVSTPRGAHPDPCCMVAAKAASPSAHVEPTTATRLPARGCESAASRTCACALAQSQHSSGHSVDMRSQSAARHMACPSSTHLFARKVRALVRRGTHAAGIRILPGPECWEGLQIMTSGHAIVEVLMISCCCDTCQHCKGCMFNAC